MSWKINYLEIIRYHAVIQRKLLEDNFSDLQNSDQSLLEKLVELRLRYDGITESHDSPSKKKELILPLFYELWNFLSELDPDRSLYVPPIYYTDKIIDIFNEFIENYLIREKGSTNDSGNIVLGGVEGTGKTTIAKAMLLAVNLLSSKYVFIYFDYKYHELAIEKQLPSIDVLIQELYYRVIENDFEGPFGFKDLPNDAITTEKCLKKLREEFNLGIGFIADEVQELYNYGRSHPNYALLRRIETFGRRTARAFFVLTGSSSDLHYALFQKGKNSNGELIVDFNRSLSQFFHVEALRSVDLLRDYLSRRYKIHEIDDYKLRQLLHCTGGIGRHIDNLMLKGKFESKLAESTITLAKANYRKSDSWFFFIIALLRTHNEEEISRLKDYMQSHNPEYLSSSSYGTDYHVLETTMVRTGIRNVDFLIYSFVDTGLLYLNAQKRVEVAIPAILEHLVDEISSEDLFLFGVSIAMIYSPSEVNSGKALERFLLPRLHLLPNAEFCKYYGNSISFGVAEIYLRDRDQHEHIINSLELLFSYQNQLLTWNNEIGIDGFQFFKTKNKNEITLDFWQSKGGFHEHSIGGGKIDTHVPKYLENNNVSEIYDTFFGGILFKGMVGILTILQYLHGAFPSLKIKLRNFIMTTTKEASKAKSSYQNKVNSIPPELISKFKLSLPKASSLQIKVYIYDKTGWFQSLLEPQLQQLLPEDQYSSPTKKSCTIA